MFHLCLCWEVVSLGGNFHHFHILNLMLIACLAAYYAEIAGLNYAISLVDCGFEVMYLFINVVGEIGSYVLCCCIFSSTLFILNCNIIRVKTK